MDNIQEYIKISNKKSLKERKERFLLNRILVFEKDPLPKEINLDFILSFLEKKIPKHVFDGIDIFYIGEFPEMFERNINAMYKDGAIYISNIQDDDEDIVDDIVHELAHNLEKNFSKEIYFDDSLEKEFLAKRKTLYYLLKQYEKNPNEKQFLNVEYDKDFDEYLYLEVGYPFLKNISSGLFNSAYGITSLLEYFANGFEEYILNDKKHLKRIAQFYLKN